MAVRRVVTGHDKNGKAIVLFDEMTTTTPSRQNVDASVVWTTEGFPIDNTSDDDTSTRKVGTTLANGVVFRVVEFGPGAAPRNHRTDSVDFAVVISGEIDMEMDGTIVHLKAGDTLVQRGTIHNWINNSDKTCVIAFTLVDAKPVEVAGKVLNAQG